MPIKNGDRVYRFSELGKSRDGQNTFKGLPGLLSDTLPDKYGNQLINAWLVQNDRPEDSMNPVEQLCFIGKRGMGALEFSPAKFNTEEDTFSIEIDSLVNAAQNMPTIKGEQIIDQVNNMVKNWNAFASENKVNEKLINTINNI
jgi:serine/threonine-protein kinase HipA